MNTADDPRRSPSPRRGARTAADGTPAPVDLSGDRRARTTWLVLLAGPLVWFAHFMLVYLVAEAGCTGDGPGLDVFDPPVPTVTTIVATVVAVLLCVAAAVWSWRRWRSSADAVDRLTDAEAGEEDDADDGADPAARRDVDAATRSGSLAFAGFLLSVFSGVAVLFTGAPALVLASC